MSEFKRKCPECEKVLSYSTKSSLKRAERKNSKCRSCGQPKRKEPYQRNCPSCGKTMSYDYPQSFSKAKKENSLCRSCAAKERHEESDHLDNIRPDNPGENNPFYGKSHDKETINQLKKGVKGFGKKKSFLIMKSG